MVLSSQSCCSNAGAEPKSPLRFVGELWRLRSSLSSWHRSGYIAYQLAPASGRVKLGSFQGVEPRAHRQSVCSTVYLLPFEVTKRSSFLIGHVKGAIGPGARKEID